MQEVTYEQQIKAILDNFDFKRVHKTMKLMKWTWVISKSSTHVPSISELKGCAQRLLNNVIHTKNVQWTSTGGLRAGRDKHNQLSLDFIVEDYSGCDYFGDGDSVKFLNK